MRGIFWRDAFLSATQCPNEVSMEPLVWNAKDKQGHLEGERSKYRVNAVTIPIGHEEPITNTFKPGVQCLLACKITRRSSEVQVVSSILKINTMCQSWSLLSYQWLVFWGWSSTTTSSTLFQGNAYYNISVKDMLDWMIWSKARQSSSVLFCLLWQGLFTRIWAQFSWSINYTTLHIDIWYHTILSRSSTKALSISKRYTSAESQVWIIVVVDVFYPVLP